MHLIARDRSSPHLTGHNKLLWLSKPLLGLGRALGKMPIAFGMLQRPTASIFASVQFCTANSSDLVIRWFATYLKTGRVVFHLRYSSQANVRRSPRPRKRGSRWVVWSHYRPSRLRHLFTLGRLQHESFLILLLWAHPIQSNAKHSLLGLRTIADARMPVLVREFQSRLLRDGQAQSIPDTNYCRIVG
jgi:hypothetical protein